MADMPVNLDDVDRLERRGDIKGAINLSRDGLVGRRADR
jgi:hypothetical protein